MHVVRLYLQLHVCIMVEFDDVFSRKLVSGKTKNFLTNNLCGMIGEVLVLHFRKHNWMPHTRKKPG